MNIKSLAVAVSTLVLSTGAKAISVYDTVTFGNVTTNAMSSVEFANPNTGTASYAATNLTGYEASIGTLLSASLTFSYFGSGYGEIEALGASVYEGNSRYSAYSVTFDGYTSVNKYAFLGGAQFATEGGAAYSSVNGGDGLKQWLNLGNGSTYDRVDGTNLLGNSFYGNHASRVMLVNAGWDSVSIALNDVQLADFIDGGIVLSTQTNISTAVTYFDWSAGSHRVYRTQNYGASGLSGITLNLVYDDGVSPVPVPAAVWLFGSGLLGLIGVARLKKTA